MTALLVSAATAAASTTLVAAPATWLNAVSGDWTDATRWSSNPAIPAGYTDVYLNATGSPYTVSLQGISSSTVQSLSMNAPVTLAQKGVSLTVLGATTINSGTYVLNSGANLTTTLSNSGTLSATSSRLSLSGPWTNSGTILVNAGTASLSGAWTNDGTMQFDSSMIFMSAMPERVGVFSASHGTLTTSLPITSAFLKSLNPNHLKVVLNRPAVLDNANTSLSVDDAAPLLLGATLQGGTLTSSDPGSSTTLGIANVPTLPGLMSAGILSGVALNANAYILDSALTITNGLTFANNHQLILDGSIGESPSLLFLSNQTLSGTGEIVGVGHGIRPTFTATTNCTVTISPSVTVRATRRGFTIGGNASGSSVIGPSVINEGTLSSEGSPYTFRVLTTLTNIGTIAARNGSTFDLLGSLTNLSNHTLTGGTYAAFNSAISYLNNTVTTNRAKVILSGPNSRFTPLDALATNDGDFAILDGRDFSAAAALTNTGTIRIGTGSDLLVNGLFDSSAATATLAFVIASADPESFGQLLAIDTATLGGALSITTDDYTPTLHDSFTLISAPLLEGTFATTNLPPLSFGLSFDLDYTPTTVQLTVVPEPAFMTLPLLIALVTRRRKR